MTVGIGKTGYQTVYATVKRRGDSVTGKHGKTAAPGTKQMRGFSSPAWFSLRYYSDNHTANLNYRMRL